MYADRDLLAEVNLDPDVVEAAGLAHDLGHPPFGHDGEEAICEAMGKETTSGDKGDEEGFEGNAQTFRIVTRLAAPEPPIGRGFGLNLTLRTLNAILKYPWLSCDPKTQDQGKWGAYQSEKDYFQRVRGRDSEDKTPSLEASLMDWADDVTYAVHDLDDFYRAGLIPLHRLHTGGLYGGEPRATPEAELFMAETNIAPGSDGRILLALLEGSYSYLNAPFKGTGEQRDALRTSTSLLLTRFINAVTLSGDPPVLEIDQEICREVKLLKRITKYYVIEHPRVVGVREGQRRVLKDLFEIYVEAISGRQKRLKPLLPQATTECLDSGDTPQRLAADLLVGMTERQVVQTYHRLTGFVPNPVSHIDV